MSEVDKAIQAFLERRKYAIEEAERTCLATLYGDAFQRGVERGKFEQRNAEAKKK